MQEHFLSWGNGEKGKGKTEAGGVCERNLSWSILPLHSLSHLINKFFEGYKQE